jgi:type IV secretion system protein VirB10
MSEAVTEAAVTGTPAPPPKLDPETLVLRGRPSRVVRFRRSVVVAVTGLAVAGVVFAAWVALKPRAFQLGGGERNDAGEPAKAATDALSDLPASYGDVPRLGPPLPGDLGRPILEHQHSLEATSPEVTANDRQRAAQMERERVAAEIRSARRSGLLVQTSRDDRQPIAAATRPAPVSERSAIGSESAARPGRSASTYGRVDNAAFLATLDDGPDVNPHTIQPAPSPYLLSAGSVIPASLVTGLRSDLPGLVIAQVTENVYDSPTGRIRLIPQGARLIGSYDSVVAFGQSRALVVWQRILFPDGRSLRLDNVPATDPAGYAGLADKVDFHTWTLLKGAAVSTLLGVGASLTFAGESDLVQAIRESSQQNGARAGDQLVSRDLQIRPTITVRPGTPVRLVVHRDLILAPDH